MGQINPFLENLPRWVVALASAAVGLFSAVGVEAYKERKSTLRLEQSLCKEVASIYFHINGTIKVFDAGRAPDQASQISGREDTHVAVVRSDLSKRIHQAAYYYAQTNPGIYYRLQHHDQILAIYYSVQYVLDASRPVTANAFLSMMQGVEKAIERAMKDKAFSAGCIKRINDVGIRERFLSLRRDRTKD